MTRIFDGDVHISTWAEAGLGMRAEQIVELMDYSGVEKSLTWIHPPYVRSDLDIVLKYLYESTLKYPDRLLGFGWADPHLGAERSLETAKRCMYEYGFWGVKLNGAQNYFPIDDPKMSLPIVEEIAKAGKVVGFHIGADSYDNTHPYRLMKIAKMYPETKFFAIHMGGASFEDLSKPMIEVAAQCLNITLIGSAVRSQRILNAINILGAHRVCFGSDAPFELMNVEVARYDALLKNKVSDHEKEMIMSLNLANALGLRI